MTGAGKVFRRELPPNEQWRLAWLRKWLARTPYSPTEAIVVNRRDQLIARFTPDTAGLRFRIAPSIIIRSEAELLGINTPRFALRASLQDDQHRPLGFVNLRRLKTFRDAVARRLSLHSGHELLDSLEHRVMCLADGVFDPRTAYPEYTVIVARLASLYGEESPDRGVPFVTHFPIGGGLCAQAICFQATLLRYQDAKSVFGVSEITLLASDERTAGNDGPSPAASTYLNFSGLKPSQIAAFFNHATVGLGTTVQRLYYPQRSGPQTEAATEKSRFARWRAALLAFLGSAIPVIVPVDAARMAAAFGEDFPVGMLPRYPAHTPSIHCVLAVGFHRGRNEVLLNDPSTFPLLNCKLEDLFRMMPENNERSTHSLLPVHDAPGLLPLLDFDRQPSPGLFEEASVYTQKSLPVDWEKSQWYYLRSDRDIETELTERLAGLQPHELPESALLQNVQLWLRNYSESRRQGVVCRAWLEYLPNRVCRLWDAVRPPDVIRAETGTGWLQIFSQEASQTFSIPPGSSVDLRELNATREQPSTHQITAGYSAGPTPLQTAVITSFDTAGLTLACQTLNRERREDLLDLYVFMQPDSDRLLKKVLGYTGEENPDAVEMMSKFSSDTAARMIVRRLKKLRNNGFDRIVALATYIPEISDLPTSQRGRVSAAAIEFIARVALQIRRQQELHKTASTPRFPGLRAVELVAGSRISSVYSAILPDANYPQLIAQTMSDAEAANNVVTNLKRALKNGRSASGSPHECLGQLLRKQNIALCLELEPGPLYALRDLNTLLTFCKELDETFRDEYSDLPIGFNLDIAHWRMAGISPALVPKEIRRRIGHSHIAGHDIRGHLGDKRIEAADLPAFSPWLSFLSWLPQEVGRVVPFSGVVSVEFEAARDSRDVIDSLKTVNHWLQLNSVSPDKQK